MDYNVGLVLGLYINARINHILFFLFFHSSKNIHEPLRTNQLLLVLNIAIILVTILDHRH